MPLQIILKSGIGRCEEVSLYIPNSLPDVIRPILMLHGNWATSGRYRKYGRFFAEQNFVVIAPTYRHHYRGNGENQSLGRATIQDYANDTLSFLETFQSTWLPINMPGVAVANPIVIGHSMGGLVAQMLATLIPLEALITLNSAPPAGVKLSPDRDYEQRIRKIASRIFFKKPYLPDFESMSLYVYNGMPKRKHRKLYEGAVHESGNSSLQILAGSGNGIVRIIARLLAKPVHIDETEIKCPILIIGCAKDRIIPPAIAERMHKKYSSANSKVSYTIFPQFAHWVQHEPGWESSANYILRWINDFPK